VKLSVEFPSVSYREGPGAVTRMARAIEQIGYDHIDVFDHVVMGYPIAGRPVGPYTPTMPILEALMTLSHLAAVTSRVTLGTEVLVLPQRHPTLVAKQVSTLDTLSGGRVRLGVGVGWQESEYEALGENFATRGARMDEAIRLLRAYWSDAQVDFDGAHYPVTAIAMEPKPPQGRRLPIWIGGMSEPAWRRVGRLGDGWLASRVEDAASARQALDAIRRRRRTSSIELTDTARPNRLWRLRVGECRREPDDESREPTRVPATQHRLHAGRHRPGAHRPAVAGRRRRDRGRPRRVRGGRRVGDGVPRAHGQALHAEISQGEAEPRPDGGHRAAREAARRAR